MIERNQKGISRREFLKRCSVVFIAFFANVWAGSWLTGVKKNHDSVSNTGHKPARYYKTLAG